MKKMKEKNKTRFANKYVKIDFDKTNGRIMHDKDSALNKTKKMVSDLQSRGIQLDHDCDIMIDPYIDTLMIESKMDLECRYYAPGGNFDSEIYLERAKEKERHALNRVLDGCQKKIDSLKKRMTDDLPELKKANALPVILVYLVMVFGFITDVLLNYSPLDKLLRTQIILTLSGVSFVTISSDIICPALISHILLYRPKTVKNKWILALIGFLNYLPMVILGLIRMITISGQTAEVAGHTVETGVSLENYLIGFLFAVIPIISTAAITILMTLVNPEAQNNQKIKKMIENYDRKREEARERLLEYDDPKVYRSVSDAYQIELDKIEKAYCIIKILSKLLYLQETAGDADDITREIIKQEELLDSILKKENENDGKNYPAEYRHERKPGTEGAVIRVATDKEAS